MSCRFNLIFFKEPDDYLFQIRNDVTAVFYFMRFNACPDLLEQIFRRFNPYIAGEHYRFQLFIHFIANIGIPVYDILNIFEKRPFRLLKPLLQLRKKSHSYIPFSISSSTCTVNNLETPFSSIVTPCSVLAASMDLRRCVMTINCVSPL